MAGMVLDPGVAWGWIGAIVGSTIGVAGGMVGTYLGIKHAKGPRERSFVVKVAVAVWAVVLIYLGLLFYLPPPYRWFMWVLYGVSFPLGLIYLNRKQHVLRQEDCAASQAVGSSANQGDG